MIYPQASLARVASRLGEANINIDYAYGGVEPGTNAPILIFGVKEVSRAAAILDEIAAAAFSLSAHEKCLGGGGNASYLEEK